jgi:alpha-glucosidase
MKLLNVIAAVCILSSASPAQWETIGDVTSYSHTGNLFSIHAGKALVNVHVLAPDLIRIRLAPTGVFDTDASWAVIKNDWPDVAVNTNDLADELRIATREISLIIGKRPLRLKLVDSKGATINQDAPGKGMSWNGSEIRVWKVMPPGETYYGFGEKAGSFERRGTHMSMWNSDIPAYSADTDPLYQSHPFFYGVKEGKAYAIFFDNTYWSSFDMGKENRAEYSFGAEAGELDYYFFYGPSLKKILSRYTELVGRMPLPPRWSLGYQQCRWSYPTETRVREIANGFRQRNIPCDVMYLDIDYMDGYRIFTWNTTNFPDPKKMIADLAKDGFTVAVIVDPGIKADTTYHAFQSGTTNDVFVKYPNGKPFIGKVWPGECAFPDFTSASARTWWGNNFSALIQAGVRGWWNDMNEPSVFDVPTKTIDLDVVHHDNGRTSSHAKSHNIYGMQMTRATYEGVRRLLPTERPFVLTRASYAGGHRYAAAWTGDNTATWSDLRMSVPMLLNLSISGQPFVGADIGGFIGYPGGELFARWLQLGVFTPLMRAHSVINEKNKEPWEYGDAFTAINRETINLRYALLPLIYNVMYQAATTGIPAMRPMIFQYPGDQHFLYTSDQFMFGDDLLVAPVLTPETIQRRVRLPQGSWYYYWDGKQYDGERDVQVDAPLNRIPFFVRAGAMIPTQQVVQYTTQSPINPLTFSIYPTEGNATFSYYEDDGISFNYEKGMYMKREITQKNSAGSVVLRIGKREGSYVPPKRLLCLRFINMTQEPRYAALNDKRLQRVTASEPTTEPQTCGYNADARVFWITLQDSVEEQNVTVAR